MCFADALENQKPLVRSMMIGEPVGPCVVQGCPGTVLRNNIPGHTVQARSEPDCRSPFVQASDETVRVCANEVGYNLKTNQFMAA